MESFTFFWRETEPLGEFSQWFPCSFTVDGVTYNCAEQFMMAGKAKLFNDPATLAKIMKETDPHQQKKMGREVKNYLDPVWSQNAKDIVYNGNYAKFSQNPNLKELLLNTQGTLVEASPYDRIWGIGLAANDKRAKIREAWRGTNWLGEVLTRLRENLR